MKFIDSHSIKASGIPLLLGAMLSLTACSDDGQPAPDARQRQLTLSLGSRQLASVDGTGTRSLPEGFVTYESLYGSLPDADTRLLAFITPQTTGPVMSRLFRMQAKTEADQGTHWLANITVDDLSQPYYIYGFMPIAANTSDNVSIARIETPSGYKSYQEGAVITARNLNAVTEKDVCVIVGVKGATTGTASIEDDGIDIKPGAFEYTFAPLAEEADGNQDYLYMLLDHVYMGLQLKICTTEEYGALRTIRLKKMQMVSADSPTVNATITLTATADGSSPIASIAYANNSGPSLPVDLDLTPEDDGSEFKVTTTPKDIMAFVCPTTTGSLVLSTTYDVYDKAGNLLREDCKAVNTIPLSLTDGNRTPGTRHTLRITVNPTYLYVLADPDLDTPTFKVD